MGSCQCVQARFAQWRRPRARRRSSLPAAPMRPDCSLPSISFALSRRCLLDDANVAKASLAMTRRAGNFRTLNQSKQFSKMRAFLVSDGHESGVQLSRGLHVLAADLKIETVRIFDVITIVRVGLRVEDATLQFGTHRLLIPIVDGVRNVIDSRRRGPRGRVARN